MFPKEIEAILLKYKNDISNELENVNSSINKIIKELLAISCILIDKQIVYSKSPGVENKNKEIELFNDSLLLREYVDSISLLECKESIDVYYYEDIIVDVINDNICPKCNVKIKSHEIHYKTEQGNAHIWWYKCPCCERLYCIDKEIEDFDFNDTNIVANYIFEEQESVLNLAFTDVIVLSTINVCTSKEHDVSDVIANIPTFKPDGSIEYISQNISYCKQCNKYIMLKSDFKAIENVIACQVIDKTITRDKSNSDEIEIKQYESVLYRYGYNVKTKENLSNKQRHLILASVVESGILTRQQICSHLDTLIERGSKIPKWKDATQKWKQDREYVKNYNPENLPEVLVNRVITKYSQMKLF